MKKFIYKECTCITNSRGRFFKGQTYLYRKLTLENGKKFYYVLYDEKHNIGFLYGITQFPQFFKGEFIYE